MFRGFSRQIIFAVLTVLFLPCRLFAAEPAGAPDFPEQRLEAVAQDATWLALLHVDPEGVSYVDDADFFLAQDGVTSPYSELKASLQAFSRNNESRCRFIARFMWLKSIGLIDSGVQPVCAEYQQWREQMNVGSVALVFASSYLNSPSSMYGHTFLRIDPAGMRAESPLLSYAVNYTATVPEDDNNILYMWRGLSGGYPGGFFLLPYVEKLQEYSRLENRDIWEYELSLRQDEIDRMLAHIWELQNINFDYYFADENCSFRLLELLEVARPGMNLTANFDAYAIPVDTIRSVRDAGLVTSVNYRPSRQKQLTNLFIGLSSKQQEQVLALADNPSLAETGKFQRQPEQAKYQMLMAAYRYLRYEHNRDQRDSKVAARSLQLLTAINQLPKSETALPAPRQPTRPDLGHETRQWGVTAGHLDDDDYFELEGKITYHELLDSIAGYPEGASLNTLRARIRKTAGQSVRLQALDVIDIRSLAVRNDFFQPLSWQVKGGVERPELMQGYLAPYVTGGAGGTWRVLGGSLSALAIARIEYNEGFADNWQIASGPDLLWFWQGEKLSSKIEAAHTHFVNGTDRSWVGAGMQYSVGQQGVRLELKHLIQDSEDASEVSLQWRFYF